MATLPSPSRYWNHVPYARGHSESVVNAFCQKYARATCFFAKKCRLTPLQCREALIRAYRFQNNRWNRIRDCIKLIEKHNRYEEYAKLDYETFVYYMSVTDFLETGKVQA